MKVYELIAILETMSPESRVVVSGYETGYDDITLIKPLAVLPESNPSWFNGRYDEAPTESADQGEPAVLLFGRNSMSSAGEDN
jgi:hypothetical protein